jgi:uncharacterized RDD family membrane protein YckC
MPITDETLDIQTPENVAFDYHVAGIGSRFLSTMIDMILIVLIEVVVIFAMQLVLRAFGDETTSNKLSAWVIALFGLVTWAFFWGYYVFFELLWNGQSPGKRWVGLRVIRGDGMPISMSESFIRNLVRIIDFLPATYGIGVITMFIDKQSRRLGDLAAGTLVVLDRAPMTIQELSVKRAVNLRPWKTVPLDGFPVERLTNNDLNLIEDFLQRRDQLTHSNELAIQILNMLYTRFGLPLKTLSQTEAEDMLATLLDAAQKLDKE